MMLLKTVVTKVYAKSHRFVTGKDDGASFSEYALLLAVVTLALVGAITACSSAIKAVFDDAKTEMSSTNGG